MHRSNAAWHWLLLLLLVPVALPASAQSANLVVNPGFSTGDLSGWVPYGNTSLLPVFSSDDCCGSSPPGSVEVSSFNPVYMAVRQCIGGLGAGPYDFAAMGKLTGFGSSSFSGLGSALSFQGIWFASPDCTGPDLGSTFVGSLGQYTPLQVWLPLGHRGVTPPAGAASVRLQVDATAGRDASLGGRFDDLSFAPTPPGRKLFTLAPCRLFDSRLAGSALAAGAVRRLAAPGTCGIPATARALSVNLTVVAPAAPGYLSLLPGDPATAEVSTINFGPGSIRANNAVFPLVADGSGTFEVVNHSAGQVHFLIDVNGYFE
jgi:hypothetical protein